MKTFLPLFFVTILSNILIAQTTLIPDVNFEQELINLGYDSGSADGMVLTANIDTVTALYLNSLNIGSLTGIEDFVNLEYLECRWNQLTSLDVTFNASLTYLNCMNNQITALDVTQNSFLTILLCAANQIASLNLTSLNLLTNVACSNNQLSTLDVSQNPLITDLNCFNNLLTCLNVKNCNNTNFTSFSADFNPLLSCIEVDDSAYSATNWTYVDFAASFSTNCFNFCSSDSCNSTTTYIKKNNLTNLSLYPNPTNGIVNIVFGKFNTGITGTLTNYLGQVVFAKRFESNNIKLDIKAPKGAYFLHLKTEQGETKTIKVIKN